MDEKLPGEEFAEFSPGELADALRDLGSLEDGPVEIEVQSPDGHVIVKGVVRLHVGRGHDFDRVGGYTWGKITARLEPSAMDVPEADSR